MTVDPGSRGWNEHRHRWDVPAGTIQTADFADGSVTTPKLVDGAVSQAARYLAIGSNTTTSTVAVALPSATVSLTTTGGVVLVIGQVTVIHSLANGNGYLYIQQDALGYVPMAIVCQPSSGAAFVLPLAWLTSPAPAAGAHSWNLGWSTPSGTLTQWNGANTELMAIELKR